MGLGIEGYSGICAHLETLYIGEKLSTTEDSNFKEQKKEKVARIET